MKLQFNYKNAIEETKLGMFKEQALKARSVMLEKSGPGNDYLGWVNHPNNYDQEEFARIKVASKFIQANSDVLLVIGIGGSYLGAKAIIEAFKEYFSTTSQLEIIFVGHTLSSTYTTELLNYLENKDFSINVISKSGTTTEPAIAFRLFKQLLVKKYGEHANERIFATTDAKKGALRTLAENENYETFIVPDDIGGRYSWFTAVGLLPIACAGIDIDQLMEGSKLASHDCMVKPFEDNDALKYASCRHLLYKSGKRVEILVSYEPKLSYISEWWKQLFGESEGKEHQGIFPASLVYSTDLHSMGQYVQEGERIMFETVLNVTKPKHNIILQKQESDLDGLNYLAGVDLDKVNKKAMEGTIMAHVDGGVPNLSIEIEEIDEKTIGYLLYFFMFSCGVCCYMLGVNPFNQPGVEDYKRNMFALLGKPGFEELKKKLEKRL